jgi:hypothetical protein
VNHKAARRAPLSHRSHDPKSTMPCPSPAGCRLDGCGKDATIWTGPTNRNTQEVAASDPQAADRLRRRVKDDSGAEGAVER